MRWNVIIVFVFLMFAGNIAAQTSIDLNAGIGVSHFIKIGRGLGNTFEPSLYQQYGGRLDIKVFNKLNFRLINAFSSYSCIVGLPDDFILDPRFPDYKDDHARFYYYTLSLGLKYNLLAKLGIEGGLANNFYLKHTNEKKGLEWFTKIRKNNAALYWSIHYIFFDVVELGYVNHNYLHTFAQYPDDMIDIYFKNDVWYCYISYKYIIKGKEK